MRPFRTVLRGPNARNAVHNLANSVVGPLLMVLSAPFLLRRLGLEQFGIWMLGNSVVGTLGFFSAGLGDATVRYVSAHRSRGDEGEVARVVRTTWGLNLLLSTSLALVLFAVAGPVVHHLLEVHAASQGLAIRIIELGGLGLVARSTNSVFASTLRGVERYDLTTRVTIIETVAGIAAAVLLASLRQSVVSILAATIVITYVGAAVQATMCSRLLPGLRLRPSLNRGTLREVGRFGLYSWVQLTGGLLFSQADRILVASILGVRELAYYTICTQLAQQIHLFTAAAFHFVLPASSRVWERRDFAGLHRAYRRAMMASLFVAGSLTVPLLFAGRLILSVWLGDGFADHASGLLRILGVAYALLAVNIVPHNVLLGIGEVRYVAVTNLAAGVATVLGVAAFAATLGLQGAGLGNIVYGLIILLNLSRVARRLP